MRKLLPIFLLSMAGMLAKAQHHVPQTPYTPKPPATVVSNVHVPVCAQIKPEFETNVFDTLKIYKNGEEVLAFKADSVGLAWGSDDVYIKYYHAVADSIGIKTTVTGRLKNGSTISNSDILHEEIETYHDYDANKLLSAETRRRVTYYPNSPDKSFENDDLYNTPGSIFISNDGNFEPEPYSKEKAWVNMVQRFVTGRRNSPQLIR
jgi:hypothetical protein